MVFKIRKNIKVQRVEKESEIFNSKTTRNLFRACALNENFSLEKSFKLAKKIKGITPQEAKNFRKKYDPDRNLTSIAAWKKFVIDIRETELNLLQEKKKQELRIFADKVKVVSIDSIKLDPKNARKNNGKVTELMNLIKRYGQRTAITVNMDTNVVYKGNTTLKAMRKLGYTKIAITPQPFEDQREITGYSLSDNKSSEWTDWDETMVNKLLKEDFEGVSSPEIANLTGFQEKELLNFSDNENKQSKNLDDIDLGDIDLDSDKVDYMVIQFVSRKEMQKFKAQIDPEKKYSKVLPFKILSAYYAEDEDVEGDLPF